MTDTRPAMTSAEFRAAASYVDNGWWQTGENLIHVSAVMDVEGWNIYGSPGHARLTPAQQTLMMWSDIVGQTSNGGFTQYCDNYAKDLRLGVAAVRALGWPELQDRFEASLVEKAGSVEHPVNRKPVALTDEPEKWEASKQRLLQYLARRGKRWWQPSNPIHPRFTILSSAEFALQLEYIQLVTAGEMSSGGEQYFDFVPPPVVMADAFDSWLYSDEAKHDSTRYVGAFILRHADELHRPL